MEVSSIFGLFGFIFGMSALAKVIKLEKRLKDLKVLDQEIKSD